MKAIHNYSRPHDHVLSSTAVTARMIAVSTIVMICAVARPATFTWTNTVPDYYTNAANWDQAAVPGSADTALIANGGTALCDSSMSNLLTTLLFGGIDASGGNITMSGGVLSITNNANANLFLPGYYNNSSGTFTLNGGTFNIARPSTSNRYFQDGFQPGFGVGSSGAVVVNNGTLNILCGFECGIDGAGTLTVNGGTVMDNGWFTVGRGGSSGSGFFNLTGGTVYHLKNPGTDSRLRIQYATGVPGTVNISGGALYTPGITLCANNAAGTATLNISGGAIYLGEGGVAVGNFVAGQVKTITVSGGTFHTVLMDPNTTGQTGLSSVHVGGPGTNWTWTLANQPTVNLTTSPGPGVVMFAPEAGKVITLNNVWGGSGAMAITGPGTVIFGATNTYVGGTTVSGGTLQLNASQPASIISGLTVNTGAALGLSSAQTSAPMSTALQSGSTLLMNNNAQIIDATLVLPSGATLDFNASTTQFFTNNVSGAGNVVSTLSGNGIEVVTGILGHSGSTVVSNGIVAIGGTLNNSTGVIVTNTGTLAGNGLIGSPITVASANNPTAAHLRIGISPLNVPDTLTVTNLTLGAGSEFDVKLGASTTVGGGINDLLVVRGNLTINPNAFVNVLPMQGLAAGTYVIVQYSGTLTGQFTNSVGGLTRYGLALDYSTSGQIKLTVSGSNAGLVYAGVSNNVAIGNWDVLTTPNWTNSATLLADTFREGDAVTFDDTTRNTNVVITTTLYPASITFNGNTNWSLTGSGSGRITGGTGITKNGNGTVLLAAGLGVGNDYTGPVNINGGILKMNGALSLGATNGGTTVASGATLDINGQTAGNEPLTLQGAGFGGTNGAINNSSGTAPSQTGGPRFITLAGDTTINASGNRWDIGNNTLGVGGGSFTGGGFKLTKVGAQQIWMHELGDIGVGDILVNQGTLGFQYTIGLGDPSKTITVMSGATFGIWQAPALSKQVTLTNSTLYSDGASNALTGTISLLGTNTIQANTAFGALSPIAGTGGFHKTGPAPLYLPAANTYSGSTFIDAGSVLLGLGGSIANSTLISVATNTLLDASLAGGLNVGSGKALSGSGSINGNVSASAGSQIAPGTATAAGTLTFNNNLALNGATNAIKLGGDPFTSGNGVNDLISINGDLTATGVSTIQITPLGILSSAGAYNVLQYQYTGTTPSAANFQVVSTSSRYTPTLVDPASTPGNLQVSITGNPGLLVWKGGVATNANIWNNSTTNWLNLTTSARDAYLPGDNAIFDDTAVTNIVNLATTAAGLISLSNNTTAYTLTGNGLITAALDMEGTSSLRLAVSNPPALSSIAANSGALIFDVQGVGAYTNFTTISDNGAGQGTLVKAGTNTLVLSAPDNSAFNGTVVVTNGVLQYTNATDLGSGGAIYITNNGMLELNAIAITKPVTIAGNGFTGRGAVFSSGAAIANAGLSGLTLAGDAAIGASNRFDVTGTVNGNGFKLTELGPGAHLFTGNSETYFGDIHIVAGRLGFQGSLTTMGDVNKTCTIESNAVLTFFSAGTQTKNIVFNGNATFDSGGSANTFNGLVILAGTNNLFGLRVDLHVSGGLSGSGSLVVGDSPIGAGTGTLYLDAGGVTYTGSTTINSGHAIVVGASSSLGSSSLVRVNSGGTLDVSAPGSFTFAAGQTLIGSGTVTGAVAFASGATLAPGLGGNDASSLTVIGAATLSLGSTNRIVVNKTTSVANSKVIGLTSVAMAGTLVVNNVGNPLAAGDAITLFSASSYSGAYNAIVPTTPGAGLAWNTSTLTADGTLRVVSSTNPNPTNLIVSVSGNQLTFSWPSDHTGWTLQSQTNGLFGTWFDVAGSATTNQITIPIDRTKAEVFYRMILH